MAAMQAVYYRAADGTEPVDEFVEALRDPGEQRNRSPNGWGRATRQSRGSRAGGTAPAEALEMRFLIGFEHGPAEKRVRDLVLA